MPLYRRRCDNDHDFEVLRSVKRMGNPELCPECGETSQHMVAGFSMRVSSTQEATKPYEQPAKRGPQTLHRMAGGKAVVNKQTGGYRPAITHHTWCPQENHERNVAILGKVNEGQRLNCEYCGYLWIFNKETSNYPLVEGVKESLRRPLRFTAGVQRNPESGYQGPERAA